MFTEIQLNIVFLMYLIVLFKFRKAKYFSLTFKPKSTKIDQWFIYVFIILMASIHFVNALIGIKWDEHYIALGGYYISRGLVPHLDFYIPNGTPIYYLQSLGNFIFDDLGLAYAFPACFTAVLFYVYSYLKLKRIFKFNTLECLLLSMIYLLCCSFWGGALWYNQLAFLCCTVVVLIQLDRIYFQKDVRVLEVLSVSLMFALALLTKLDIALLFMILFLVLQFFTVKPLKFSLCVFALISISLCTYYLIFKCLLDVDVLKTMNFSQEGFDARLPFEWKALSDLFQTLLLSSENIGVRFLFFAHLFFYLYNVKMNDGISKVLAFSQFYLLLASAVVLWSSGRGAGYVNSHMTFISAIILLMFLKRLGLKHVSGVSLMILMPLILIFLFQWRSIFVPKYHLVKHKNKNLYSSERTVKFFNFIDQQLVKSSDPVVLYSGMAYFNMSDRVSMHRSSRYLWDHLGTTIKHSDSVSHTDYFVQNLPDIFVENSFRANGGDYSILQNFGLNRKKIETILQSEYDLNYSGNIDLIGSGGGLKVHQVKVYILKSYAN